ncbi:MAG TPA: hypothetical protein PLU30_16790 [Verrucomicrobiae bacterium]|nr:hypothetical protein [Verrucomicrobiae bacterium]
MFQDWWRRGRAPAPIRGRRRVFGGRARFPDPWNDLLEYLEDHPGFSHDRDRHISLYAWSDPDEDFAEVFAEVVMRSGDIAGLRHRPDVHRKARFLVAAGRRILGATPALRRSNRRGMRYAFGGGRKFICPASGDAIGVPLVSGDYLCPCGGVVSCDGARVTHREG